MFLRVSIRKKDGKEHRYFSIVENKRLSDGRVVQRHVLYLGEINSSQELAWRKSIEVLEEGSAEKARTLALFPEDRCEGLVADESIVRLKLSQLRLQRPRQWGGCWLALTLWRELQLDEFWAQRLLPSRKGTRWDEVLAILTIYRLLSRAANGGCIGSGIRPARFAIFWVRMRGLMSRCCIAAMIDYWNTSKRCSIIW